MSNFHDYNPKNLSRSISRKSYFQRYIRGRVNSAIITLSLHDAFKAVLINVQLCPRGRSVHCYGLSSRPREQIFKARSARAGGATDFNLVKNQSRGHAKKVKCSSTSKRVRAHKSRQKTLRLDTYSES